MKRIVLISSISIVLIATFFSGAFIPKRSVVAVSNFIRHHIGIDLYQENILLKLQNENLKAQLQRAIDVGDGVSSSSDGTAFIEARIFSMYPFNMKGVVAVDRGLDDGVTVGMVAVVSEHILFGRVASAEAHSATIQTIFDPRLQVPVKIGPDAINGLFEGGNDPRVVLVERPIKSGDGVFSAAKEFPIGIKIGEVKEVRKDGSDIFTEATVRASYAIGEIIAIRLLRP